MRTENSGGIVQHQRKAAQGHVQHVVDMVEKIADLSTTLDPADIARLKTASELKLWLIAKYLPDTKAIEQTLVVAGDIKHSGIKSIVIDTETGFVRLSKLQEFSEAIGGKYYQLEDIKAEAISGLVREAIG